MKTVYVNMEVSEKASQPAVCRAAVPATARVKLSALNPHLICVLCGGYYIDATTIIECLHSFCRTCIIRYLATSKYCPVCEVQVHKTRPLHHIRQDKTLQDLVYKLVPGLFKEEMKRRRDYYKSQADDGGPSTSRHGGGEERGEAGGYYDRVIYTEDEKISLSLELRLNGRPPRDFRKRKVNGEVRMKSYRLLEAESCDRRFLLCPAAVTVAHLKKFIRMKFSLSERYNIDVFHTDENLSDLYTLMDIAYIYSWRRRGPLRLFYTVYEFPAKKRRLNSTDTDVSKETSKEEEEVAPSVSPPVVNGDANSINNNDDNNNENNNNDDNSNNDNNNNDEGPIDLVKKSPENVQKTEPPLVVEPKTNGEVSDIVRTPSPLSNEKPSNINSVTQSPPRENLSPKTEAPSLSVNSAEPTSSSQTEAVSESLTKTSVVPPPPVEESVEENKPINMVMTAAVKKEPVEIEDTTGQT